MTRIMEPAFTTFCSRYVLLTLTIFTVATQARPGANNFATQQESDSVLELIDRLDKALDNLIQENEGLKNTVVRNEDGPVPYRREQVPLSLEQAKSQVERNEDGPVPYAARSLEESNEIDSVSLQEVMRFLQNLRRSRAQADRDPVHVAQSKRDYDIPFPFH